MLVGWHVSSGQQVFFWFLVCYAASPLALQLHQERIQVVRSNRVVWKRPPRGQSRNGSWTWSQESTHTHIGKQKRNRIKLVWIFEPQERKKERKHTSMNTQDV